MLEAYRLEPDAFTSSFAEREVLPLEWWTSRLNHQQNAAELVLGAFLGESLVGASGLAFELRQRTQHKATLFGMYVKSAFRGKGLGRLLIEQLLSHSRGTARLDVIQLTVSESNVQALKLYGRCGFVPFGTEPMAVKLGDRYIAKVHMWQRLIQNAP